MNTTASRLPDPATVPHFRPSGVSPLDQILSSTSERVRQRVQWFTDRIETLNGSIEGAFTESGHATEAWEIDKTNLARLEQQSVIPDSGVTEEMVKDARRKEKATSNRRDKTMQRHRDLIAEREALKVMLGSCTAHLAQRRAEAQDDGPGRLAGDDHEPAPLDLEEVSVDEPDTDEACREVIADVTQESAGGYTERQEVEQAPPPAQYAKDSARLEVERLAARGKPRVTQPSATEEVSIVWPAKALNASGRASHPGERPQVVDVEAMAARYWGDQIIADVEAEIDRAYAGIELTLEPHERRKRLRQIDAKILHLQRREAAAIWKLIEEFGDEDVTFRPGTNPRALLGIA